MKMMIGQNLKREDGHRTAAQLIAKYKLAAGLGVTDHSVHFVAEQLEHARGRRSQHHKCEGELQAHAPQNQRRANIAPVFGEENANQQDREDSQYAGEPLHS